MSRPEPLPGRETATLEEGRRIAVVNADDYGMSRGVNRGVVEAHRRGVVTSASLLVCGAAAEAAAALALRHPRLAVGLHLDLGEWVLRRQRWEPRYQRVDLDDAAAVGRELDRQLVLFRSLLGRDPTHLDSHQHVHMNEPVRTVAAAVSARLGIPLRGVSVAVRHEGGFHGRDSRGQPYPQGITPANLQHLLAELPPGVTEIGCHPGAVPEDDAYGAERVVELRTLCDPAVAAAIPYERIALRSFLELNRMGEAWAIETAR